MFKHYLKVSIKNFKRFKVSFILNLLGLVSGLFTALFIYLWVHHEMSIDQFHEDEERLYRLVSDNSGNETLLNSSPLFANQLLEEIPEIELLVNSSWAPLKSNLMVDQSSWAFVGEFGSQGFFELFTYPLLIGDKKSVLTSPNAIVLSESTAMKLFKTMDVIGKTLEWRWYSAVEQVIVTGVYSDLPSTSSAQFDYVLSFDIFERRFQERIARGNRNARSFIKLADEANVSTVNNKIKAYSQRTYPENDLRAPFLIGYSHYYLHSQYENGRPVGGKITIVRLFVIIGILILLIACINFMNLSTARAVLRTKEIGVRKVMGAQRRSLVYQYLTESCTISLLAGLVAIGFLALTFPLFQQLIGKKINIDINPQLVLSSFIIILLTGLVSGSYPALYLSGFSPLRILRGQMTTSMGDRLFRKTLVVFQFVLSLVLIVSMLVIYQQMRFIQTKSLGYSNSNILNFETKGMRGKTQLAFLDEVRQLSGILKASGISHALFGAQKSSANISWKGKDPEKEVWFDWGYLGLDMLELLELEVIQGRFFSRDFGNEISKVVINETTQKLMAVEDPVGQKLEVGESTYEIIGVAKDFHFKSLHEPISPTFFLLNSGWSMKLAIRIRPENMNQTIEHIEMLYSKFNPGFSFDYSFHDYDQEAMYDLEMKMSVLSKYAACLAVFISCLGLFGLMSFVAERKAKEMGIRKVLGASSKSLVMVLSRDFALPIAIASIFGVIMSAYLMTIWLKGFAYRIELEWWFFVVSVGTMLLLASITLGTKIINAMLANPIASLKDE